MSISQYKHMQSEVSRVQSLLRQSELRTLQNQKETPHPSHSPQTDVEGKEEGKQEETRVLKGG